MVNENASNWITPKQSHRSDKRVIVVVLIGLITFSAGIAVGYSTSLYISAINREQSTVDVQGTVSSPKDNLCCYHPDWVDFVTSDLSGLSTYRAGVNLDIHFQNYTAEYGVYLPSDTTYYVYLGFLNSTAGEITQCVPTPSYIVVSHSMGYSYHFTGGLSWIEQFNFRC